MNSRKKSRKKSESRKALRKINLTGVERMLKEHELIVSKTDPTGRITYANQVFLNISDYSENEVIGAPHSILRHPDMPRAVYKLLWERIASGNEIFSYVVNLCKSGDHYWVFAHVTPSWDSQGNIIGYHSNRRMARASALETIKPLYKELLQVESAQGDRRRGLESSYQALLDKLSDLGVSYDEFIFSI